MGAADAEYPGPDESWHGPITSPADFHVVVEDALFDARRFADAYPAIWVYQSIVGLLDGIQQMTADGHRPRDDERAPFESLAPTLRQQWGEANTGLTSRVDAVWAYVLEWPVGAKPRGADDDAPGPGDPPLLSALDDIVVLAHQLGDELNQAGSGEEAGLVFGPMISQARQMAAQLAERETREILKAIEDWAQTGRISSRFQTGPEPVMARLRHLQHYVPEQAAGIRQLRRSFAAWKEGVFQPGDGVVSSFDGLISAIHECLTDVDQLQKIARDHPALSKLQQTFSWMLAPIRDWISDLKLPANRETAIEGALCNELDLLTWPQLPDVVKGVRMLGEMLANWVPEAFGFFRKSLYETAIDLYLLQTISATHGVDDVARCINQLLYRTADGKLPPTHERAEIRLGEAYQRELAIYNASNLPAFLARVRAIDAFWKRWTPSAGEISAQHGGDFPGQPSAKLVSRHDAERGAIVAVQQGRQDWELPIIRDADPREGGGCDPIAEAKGMTPEYFQFLLDGGIRAIDLPMKYPFSRALSMQLRAMRRATEGRRNPTKQEQQLIGRGFAALGDMVGPIEEPAGNSLLKDAWMAHLYFQILPGGDGEQPPTATPAGMIADAKHFSAVIEDIIADVACLAVFFPNHDTWVDAFRQLERLSQRVSFGRELDDNEKREIERALGNIPQPPADLFANVPEFSGSLVERVRQVFDYSRGRRASTRAAFDELLRAVLLQMLEILIGQNWDEDQEPLAAIDRQLRAMRRWTAGGRSPTSDERESTQAALAVVNRLRGLDRMTEWAGRVNELATAFCDDLPAENLPRASTPEIVSVEAFGVALDECLRDCRGFAGRGLFHKTTADETVWAEAAKNLAIIRRMLDQGRVPTRRERAEIHRVISGIGPGLPSPSPAIHDFLADLAERLSRVDAYYAWLVTAGPYAGKETGNIEEAGVQCVTLGGEMRVAFARAGDDAGIYVCMAEKVCTREQTAGIDIDVMRYLPSTKNLLRLVPCDGWLPSEIRWNAHGDFLAYQISASSGRSAQVGWSETRTAGEKGRVTADAFAWTTQGSNLILIDVAGRQIFRVNADDGQRKDLVSLAEEALPGVRPQIAIAPGGGSLAYTCGRADGSIDLCLIEFAGVKPVSRVRKNFPGAAAVFPFWGRPGNLACMVVGSPGGARTGTSTAGNPPAESSTASDAVSREIISLSQTTGDGERLYHDGIIAKSAADAAPAWSATGKFIAFFNTAADGANQLVLFDWDTQELRPLLKPGVLRGRLTFGEETLAAEGADAATIVWPHVSHQREAAERF